MQSTSWLFERFRVWFRVNELVTLHDAMQEKLKTASYLEQIQIPTLEPDKWSRMNFSEYFNVLEYLVWTSYEIKQLGGILVKPAPEKRKNYHHWHTSTGNHVYEETISVGRSLKRKTMLVWVKEYINKNFATCRSLCNLQELYTAFKEKQPNANIGFSRFCALRPKWCVLAGSKMTYFACVCSAQQNVVLLWTEIWHKKTWSN